MFISPGTVYASASLKSWSKLQNFLARGSSWKRDRAAHSSQAADNMRCVFSVAVGLRWLNKASKKSITIFRKDIIKYQHTASFRCRLYSNRITSIVFSFVRKRQSWQTLSIAKMKICCSLSSEGALNISMLQCWWFFYCVASCSFAERWTFYCSVACLF